MNLNSIKEAIKYISKLMTQNKDYLIELDSKNGDGDLGISMSAGYKALADYINTENDPDLGKLFLKCSGIFNETAPSSLGTITAFAFMGMAKKLKGKEDITIEEFADAMNAGTNKIMEKAKSKLGEKTILDSLCPAIAALKENSNKEPDIAFKAAAIAAANGAESTILMRSVHGRAAYYGDKSIGILDGGAVVGKLIFDGISAYCSQTSL